MARFEKKISGKLRIATEDATPYSVALPIWRCEHCQQWQPDSHKREWVNGAVACPTCFECWQETRQ